MLSSVDARPAGGVDHLLVSNLDRLASLERVRICASCEDQAGLLRDIPATSDEADHNARTWPLEYVLGTS